MWRGILTGTLAAACRMLTVGVLRDRRPGGRSPSRNVLRPARPPEAAREDGPKGVTVIYNVSDVIEIEEITTECTRDEAAEMLVRVITETVSPDTWRAAGGSIGSIRELSGLLVVTQTVEGHEQVLRL